MPDPDLDLAAGLARLRDAAAGATSHRDPAATERGGRRRRRARRAGAALAAAAAVAALVVVTLPRQQAPEPLAVPATTAGGATEDATEMSAQPSSRLVLPPGWVETSGAICPGRAGHPEAVHPPPGVPAVEPGCPPAAAPFALVEWRPEATLAGAAGRTVAGRAVLVRPGPAGTGPLPAPPGWTVTTALLPGEGGATWLQVAEPGPGRPEFERVLAALAR